MADIPESTKMLPCPNPWCENIRGVEAARHITTAKWHICCGDCLIDGPWADTCDLAIAAWNTRAAPPAMDREAVEKVREAAYRQALEDVCNPLGYLQRMADAEGAKLSGMAYAIASDIGTIQRIAKEALSTLSADAIRQGEETFRPYSEWSEDDRDVLWWKLPVQQAPYVGSPLDLGFAVGAHLYNQFGEVIGRTEANVGGWPFSESDETDLVWSRLPATPASHASDGGEA